MGLEIPEAMLRALADTIDPHGDGLLPTAPVLEFLREEAGLASRVTKDSRKASALTQDPWSFLIIYGRSLQCSR